MRRRAANLRKNSDLAKDLAIQPAVERAKIVNMACTAATRFPSSSMRSRAPLRASGEASVSPQQRQPAFRTLGHEHIEMHNTAGPGGRVFGRGQPLDTRAHRQLQQRSPRIVDEQQPGQRIEFEVAQRVEEAIAG